MADKVNGNDDLIFGARLVLDANDTEAQLNKAIDKLQAGLKKRELGVNVNVGIKSSVSEKSININSANFSQAVGESVSGVIKDYCKAPAFKASVVEAISKANWGAEMSKTLSALPSRIKLDNKQININSSIFADTLNKSLSKVKLNIDTKTISSSMNRAIMGSLGRVNVSGINSGEINKTINIAFKKMVEDSLLNTMSKGGIKLNFTNVKKSLNQSIDLMGKQVTESGAFKLAPSSVSKLQNVITNSFVKGIEFSIKSSVESAGKSREASGIIKTALANLVSQILSPKMISQIKVDYKRIGLAVENAVIGGLYNGMKSAVGDALSKGGIANAISKMVSRTVRQSSALHMHTQSLVSTFAVTAAAARNELTGWRRSLARVGKNLDILGTRANRMGNMMQQFASRMTVFLSAPVGYAMKNVFDTTLQYEKARLNLSTVMGNAGAADIKIGNLRDVSSAEGYDFSQLVSAYSYLNQAGMKPDEALSAVKGYAKGAIMSGNPESLGLAVTQIGQMFNKDSGFGQDLRSIKEQIPAIGGVLKKLYGSVASEDIAKKATGSEVALAIGRELNRMAERDAGNIVMKYNKAMAKIQLMKVDMGKVLVETIVPILDIFLKFGQKIADMPTNLKKLVVNAGLTAVVIPPLIAAFGSVFRLFDIGLKGLAKTIVAVNATISAVTGVPKKLSGSLLGHAFAPSKNIFTGSADAQSFNRKNRAKYESTPKPLPFALDPNKVYTNKFDKARDIDRYLRGKNLASEYMQTSNPAVKTYIEDRMWLTMSKKDREIFRPQPNLLAGNKLATPSTTAIPYYGSVKDEAHARKVFAESLNKASTNINKGYREGGYGYPIGPGGFGVSKPSLPFGKRLGMVGRSIGGGVRKLGESGAGLMVAGILGSGAGVMGAVRQEELSKGKDVGTGSKIGEAALTASSWASAGSMFGPWGALAGAVGGLGYSVIKMIKDADKAAMELSIDVTKESMDRHKEMINKFTQARADMYSLIEVTDKNIKSLQEKTELWSMGDDRPRIKQQQTLMSDFYKGVINQTVADLNARKQKTEASLLPDNIANYSKMQAGWDEFYNSLTAIKQYNDLYNQGIEEHLALNAEQYSVWTEFYDAIAEATAAYEKNATAVNQNNQYIASKGYGESFANELYAFYGGKKSYSELDKATQAAVTQNDPSNSQDPEKIGELLEYKSSISAGDMAKLITNEDTRTAMTKYLNFHNNKSVSLTGNTWGDFAVGTATGGLGLIEHSARVAVKNRRTAIDRGDNRAVQNAVDLVNEKNPAWAAESLINLQYGGRSKFYSALATGDPTAKLISNTLFKPSDKMNKIVSTASESAKQSNDELASKNQQQYDLATRSASQEHYSKQMDITQKHNDETLKAIDDNNKKIADSYKEMIESTINAIQKEYEARKSFTDSVVSEAERLTQAEIDEKKKREALYNKKIGSSLYEQMTQSFVDYEKKQDDNASTNVIITPEAIAKAVQNVNYTNAVKSYNETTTDRALFGNKNVIAKSILDNNESLKDVKFPEGTSSDAIASYWQNQYAQLSGSYSQYSQIPNMLNAAGNQYLGVPAPVISGQMAPMTATGLNPMAQPYGGNYGQIGGMDNSGLKYGDIIKKKDSPISVRTRINAYGDIPEGFTPDSFRAEMMNRAKSENERIIAESKREDQLYNELYAGKFVAGFAPNGMPMLEKSEGSMSINGKAVDMNKYESLGSSYGFSKNKDGEWMDINTGEKATKEQIAALTPGDYSTAQPSIQSAQESYRRSNAGSTPPAPSWGSNVAQTNVEKAKAEKANAERQKDTNSIIMLELMKRVDMVLNNMNNNIAIFTKAAIE